ncbi:CHASE2 domain-containing protein [Herbaspirillum rhizosphaerae]|uniref:CHASE2 domain-containing protein n=1 Tax=Herbaspirillum rhizosphaerae TaxID=346179 RepID=A0ABW8Z9G8_9BURK
MTSIRGKVSVPAEYKNNLIQAYAIDRQGSIAILWRAAGNAGMRPRKPRRNVAKKAISPGVLFRRIALESATALCIGILLAFLWPKIVGEEFSTRSNARIYAPFTGKLYGAAAREHTSVVLIDNAALNDAGEAWPPHYSYHARLLKALARYRPRAVFLDIYFAQVRDDATIALLTKSLCALQEQGTPVFLGVSPDATGNALLRPELESLAGRCFQKVALQYTPDSLDRLAWAYPLESEEENSREEALPSAALAIYREAFGRQLHVEDNELALTWGLQPATYGLRWLAAEDKENKQAQQESGNRLYCRQDFGVLELAPAIVKNWQHHDAEKPVCVYHETLYASDLASSSEEEEAVLKRLLEDRVVMVGAALSGGGDRVLSPLHGRIPGVYLHAMALDNLLTFGHRYPRDIHLEWSTSSSHLKLYLFLCLSLLCGLVLPKAFHAIWTDSRPTRWHRRVDHLHERWRRWWRPTTDWLFGAESKPMGKKTWVTLKQQRSWMQKCVHILRGLAQTASELLWIVLKLAMAMAVVCVFVTIGQYCFSIGLMSTVDIVFFTFAAEWFELNEKLLKKLGMRKSED